MAYQINIGGEVFSCGENVDLLKAAKSQQVKFLMGVQMEDAGCAKSKSKRENTKLAYVRRGLFRMRNGNKDMF